MGATAATRSVDSRLMTVTPLASRPWTEISATDMRMIVPEAKKLKKEH